MKCPTCESCEYAQYCGATEIMRKCERHNKKVEQTNEEWLHTLNTEQLAGFLLKIGEIDEAPIPCGDLMECSKNCGLYSQCAGDDVMPTNKEIWLEWLKQPHTPKE